MQYLSKVDDFVGTIFQTGRYRCPECSDDRKKNKRLDLQITIESDRTLYKCHHCDIGGMVLAKKPASLATRYTAPPKKTPVTHIPTPLNNSKQIILNFFSNRGVDATEVDFNGYVLSGEKYFKELNANMEAIGFMYGIEDNVQAIKWRPVDPGKKTFTQEGAARMFYGLGPMPEEADQLIIVEGEADVIALASVGVTAWSVPNGAPMKVSRGRIDPEEDKKFSYVWDAWDELTSAKKIILATDDDVAGNALKQELARRIGLEKCWEIEFPDICKDVTDVLREAGSDALKNLLTNAKQMPLKGVYEVYSYFNEVEALYKDGIAVGESTGLTSLDDLFTVKEGMLYIVTGQPGAGKSEFLDEIMVNMAQNLSWKWAVASFENPPANHISRLIEKFIGKPFFIGRSQRISHAELAQSKEFLNDHFVFLEQKDGSMATIEDIIVRIKLAIARCGCRGAVIDPYNYIDMSNYESERTGITTMLSALSSFARAQGIAIFFVAHPQKLMTREDGSLPIPKGNHISGSMAWWAKADIGITVHRTSLDVEIHCWKARFKWLGQQGVRTIGYNVVNGKYFDKEIVADRQWSDWDKPDAKGW